MEMVTIVITTYKREFYLEKCLKSVLSQSFLDFQVIVVSDGYFKETELLVQSFKDSRIKIISNIHTGLPAVSRNIGMLNVQTKYICFCDDDDVWLEDKLFLQIEFIEKNNFDIIFTGATLINSIDQNIHNKESFLLNEYNSLLLSSRNGLFLKNYICLSSTLMRSNIVKNVTFNELIEFRGTEDYLFWLELLINNYNFYFLDRKLVKYRIHENNISRNRNDAYLRTLSVIKYLFTKYSNYRFPLTLSYLFYKLKKFFI